MTPDKRARIARCGSCEHRRPGGSSPECHALAKAIILDDLYYESLEGLPVCDRVAPMWGVALPQAASPKPQVSVAGDHPDNKRGLMNGWPTPEEVDARRAACARCSHVSDVAGIAHCDACPTCNKRPKRILFTLPSTPAGRLTFWCVLGRWDSAQELGVRS